MKMQLLSAVTRGPSHSNVVPLISFQRVVNLIKFKIPRVQFRSTEKERPGREVRESMNALVDETTFVLLSFSLSPSPPPSRPFFFFFNFPRQGGEVRR